jgi:hypothetical protein
MLPGLTFTQAASLRLGQPNNPIPPLYQKMWNCSNIIEIYEGWIIRDPETGRCYEVLFRADRFMIERKLTDPKNPGYELSDLYPTNEELEVAGNIFEHPDLLAKVGYPSLYEDKPTH